FAVASKSKPGIVACVILGWRAGREPDDIEYGVVRARLCVQWVPRRGGTARERCSGSPSSGQDLPRGLAYGFFEGVGGRGRGGGGGKIVGGGGGHGGDGERA